VSVGGVTVTNATLHNEDEVEEDVWRRDVVIVRRAGDVIPDGGGLKARSPGPVGSIPKSRAGPCAAPKWYALRAVRGALHRRAVLCSPAKQALLHFASRRAMDIEGLEKKSLSISSLSEDVRYARRPLRSKPGLTSTALATR